MYNQHTKMSKKEVDKAISNIVDSMHLFNKVEYCYGEIRFHVADGQLVEPNITRKFYGTLLAILVIIGYAFVILCSWFDIKLAIFDSDIDNLIFIKKTFITVSMFQYIIALAEFFRNGNENIKIITSLAHTDCSLNVSDNRDFYKRTRKYNQIVIYVFCIMLVTAIVKHFLDNGSTAIYVVIYNVIDALADYKFDLEALAFYVYIKMLTERLDVLNKHLKQFVDNKDKSRSLIIYRDPIASDSAGYIGDVSQQNTNIASLAAAYETIGETLSLINNVFSVNMFVYLGAIFIYIILTLWSLLNFIRSKSNISFLLGIVFEYVEVISVVIIVCYICESLTLKRQYTKVLVNEIIMDYKLPKEMRIQAKAFMDLIEVWSLQVYACSMFCFNIKLLINFIGLSTSYLIVIIQATNY